MKKGFTLIELLVVIAIIGILASIVMVSMRGASDKAKDARIKGDLAQINSIAELMYEDDNETYQYLCASSTSLNEAHGSYATQCKTIEADIDSQTGHDASTSCWAASSTYCVSATLISSGLTNDNFCIDSDGSTGATTGPCTAVTTKCAPY